MFFFCDATVDGPNLTARDVSILVTEPSPECPIAPSPKNRLLNEPSTSTLVHVLVHRESEEYQTDVEDGGTDKGAYGLRLHFKFCIHNCNQKHFLDEKSIKSIERTQSAVPFPSQTDALTPQPIVTIMVESPHEPPSSDFSIDMRHVSDSDGKCVDTDLVDQSSATVIDIDDPIDVNVPRDTTNIFYDYAEPSSTNNLRDANLTDQQHIDVTKETDNDSDDADQPDSEIGLTS